jgi:hypothetical protein
MGRRDAENAEGRRNDKSDTEVQSNRGKKKKKRERD